MADPVEALCGARWSVQHRRSTVHPGEDHTCNRPAGHPEKQCRCDCGRRAIIQRDKRPTTDPVRAERDAALDTLRFIAGLFDACPYAYSDGEWCSAPHAPTGDWCFWCAATVRLAAIWLAALASGSSPTQEVPG